MPAPSSFRIDPAIGHLAKLAADAAGDSAQGICGAAHDYAALQLPLFGMSTSGRPRQAEQPRVALTQHSRSGDHAPLRPARAAAQEEAQVDTQNEFRPPGRWEPTCANPEPLGPT